MEKRTFNRKIAGIAAVTVAAVGIGGYALTHKNMTGASRQEIEAYRSQHPNTTVTYKIEIDDSLTLSHKDLSVTVTNAAQLAALAEASDYLQHLEQISLGTIPMTGELYALLTEHFPNAALDYQSVTVLGKDYPVDTTSLPIAGLTENNAVDVGRSLKALSQLREVDLLYGKEPSTASLDAVALLAAQNPNLTYQYATELFGQIISTDMETVEYFQVEIGDEGIEEFRKILPIMHKLTYLKIDWCGTTDEVMAQLREDYKDDFKVVWRVFFGPDFNLLTDSYKLWATLSLQNDDIECFKYLNEVKYLDLGHNFFSNVDFLQYMPDVEVCIIACGQLEDISALKYCQKITYLETLDNHKLDDEDMKVLAELPNVEHLNISNMSLIRDLSFTDNMTKLKRFWCTQYRGPQSELDRVKELHPNTWTMLTKGGEAVSHGWRFLDEYGTLEPTYALLRAQFGYTTYDFARYPRGYVREEITFESIGVEEPDYTVWRGR